jgi:hypothetical protein
MIAAMRRALPLSLALSLLLSVSLAHAQSPTADELLEHGVALREDGRDDEALAIFHRAYDTEPSAHAMAQIALAEHALGRLVDSEVHLVEALASDTDRFVRRNRELLEQALVEIRTQLSDLTLTGGVDGAEVLVDSIVRGTMPLPGTLRVQAGTARVAVRADGYEPYSRNLIVEAGAPITLDVVLEPVPVAVATVVEPEPTPAPPGPMPDRPRAHETNEWRFPVGIALAAAGVVGIGIASGLMAWREDNARARLTCSDVDPACRAHYGTAVDAETAGIATFVVSGLLAAAGAGLLIWELLDAQGDQGERACTPGIGSLSCVF